MFNLLKDSVEHLDVLVTGVVLYPVGKYLITRFGGAAYEDIKKVAYTVWDKAKSYLPVKS